VIRSGTMYWSSRDALGWPADRRGREPFKDCNFSKKLWGGDVMVMVETSVRSGFMEEPPSPDEGGSPNG
jgi:hypothetical protein